MLHLGLLPVNWEIFWKSWKENTKMHWDRFLLKSAGNSKAKLCSSSGQHGVERERWEFDLILFGACCYHWSRKKLRAWQPLPESRKYNLHLLQVVLRSGSSDITTHSSGQGLKKEMWDLPCWTNSSRGDKKSRAEGRMGWQFFLERNIW